MLTAIDARRLANDFERRKQAKDYVIENILPEIERYALRGETELVFKMSRPELGNFIASELENLGYFVEILYDCIFDLRVVFAIKW